MMMKYSKTAFTMIELIFVIVILGVLAAVAVPKLAATRGDAEVSKIAHEIMSGAGEIASYAVAQGATDSNFSVMSNSMTALERRGEAVLGASSATIAVGNVSDCVTLEVVTGVNDENLTISFSTAGSDNLCGSIQGLLDAKKYPMQLRGNLVSY